MKQSRFYLTVLLCFSLLLGACRQFKKEEAQSSERVSQTSSSLQSETERVSSSQSSASSEAISESETQTSASEAAPASVETKASFNGSYYSVPGKYEEVIIVNKKHPLASHYAPGEDPIAKEAFGRLIGDMQAVGYAVSDYYSGFRSYETQSGLYNSYLGSDSQTSVDTYSARPGYSEHQTGLAFDVMDTSGSLLPEGPAATWLATNAHKYGFIVRYQTGKESITGFMAEPWHLRYIGEEATAIYQSGLSLEEYLGVPGGDYIE